MRSSSLLRSGSLLAAGMLGVHQLRYLFAFGAGSSHELARQGHGYLLAVEPVVIAALALAGAQLLRAVARATASSATPAPPAGIQRRWGATAAVLLCAYGAQEWLEGLLASGHPGGLGGVVGHGGWLAVPLALAIGLLVALLERGAELVVGVIVGGPLRVRRAAPLSVRPAEVFAALVDPIARHMAGRAPPATSV